MFNIGLSASQLHAILTRLEDSGYLRVPLYRQADNGTVYFMLGGIDYSVDVHGNVSAA